MPGRWVRFHGLPGSKRYPDDESEYREVLTRHNTILRELAGPGSKVVLLTTGYSESPEPSGRPPELVDLDGDATPWRTLAMHAINGEDDPCYWHVYAGVREWRRGGLDTIFRLVADDVISNVMIVSPRCRWLLHPYDGGMDVIAGSPGACRRLKRKYAPWMSSRPDGL